MVEPEWYDIAQGESLEQGDILHNFPVFIPNPDVNPDSGEAVTFQKQRLDVIVMSQTCDMVGGREKILDILLCGVWQRSEIIDGYLSTSRGLEQARRGNLPGYHLLNSCSLTGFERSLSIVDFRRVYSLPIGFVRAQLPAMGPRLRLLPPYREHLSQAFARFFMRVGLPVDIPPFA